MMVIRISSEYARTAFGFLVPQRSFYLDLIIYLPTQEIFLTGYNHRPRKKIGKFTEINLILT